MTKEKKKARKKQKIDSLPTKAEILDFVQSYEGKAGKREIARAFNITGGARVGLKGLLREMADEGLIAGNRKSLTKRGQLPRVTVLIITSRDEHGDYIAEPVSWDEDENGPKPKVIVETSKAKKSLVAGIGNRVLADISKSDASLDDGIAYTATIRRILEKPQGSFLGIMRKLDHGGGIIDPVDKKQLKEWHVSRHDMGKTQDGDLVRYEPLKSGRFGVPGARITEILGNPSDQKLVSIIAVHRHGIPDQFPESVIEALDKLNEPKADEREDLRDLPLLTIDPPDARDHDDAVWAASDDDPANEGGFVVIVAIADVAHYIRPGSPLDKEALKRGNSVYFPDRVVPMLPEKISNDLCSLREKEDRPCLAVKMVFDKNGQKKSHRFMRALMHSVAKLSYQEAQAAIDGQTNKKTEPLLKPALEPLWAAYKILAEARDKRGPLDLNLPERKIKLDDNGRVSEVIIPERLNAHRLIEEFMIQANVAAAETLQKNRSPGVYRIHEPPSDEKLKALREFLITLEIKVQADGSLRPQHFNSILAKADGTHYAELVNEVVLRSQTQAEYNPQNAGHFGLNLRRYAHFTSPIRRYADLIVHRAIIASNNLGEGGYIEEDPERLEQAAGNISDLERRAMLAERETKDRLIAYHLAGNIGAKFPARISGTTKSGLFIKLDNTGADGFIPASTLGSDYFFHDETHHALVGESTGETFRLGDQVQVKLIEAIPSAGALRFEMLSEGKKSNIKRKRKPFSRPNTRRATKRKR